MNWTKLREKLIGTKKSRGDYYARHIKELVEAGFQMADADMEAAYLKLTGDMTGNDADPYQYLECSARPNSTSIERTTPNRYGLHTYSTHDRSERIGDAIESLTRIHAKDIKNDRAWLMPVFDDKEYVSWEFDIAIGTKEEVLAILAKAAELRQKEETAEQTS